MCSVETPREEGEGKGGGISQQSISIGFESSHILHEICSAKAEISCSRKITTRIFVQPYKALAQHQLRSTTKQRKRAEGRQFAWQPRCGRDHLLLGGGTEVLVNPIFLDEQQLKNCVFKWVMSTSSAAGGGGRADDLRGGHHLLQRDWTMAWWEHSSMKPDQNPASSCVWSSTYVPTLCPPANALEGNVLFCLGFRDKIRC